MLILKLSAAKAMRLLSHISPKMHKMSHAAV